MLQGWFILLASFAYLGLLFGIAFYADKRADAGRSLIANPYIYALSMAVYATSWTFYGSVGRAADNGVGFLPIYLGATLMAALWWLVLRKMIRISKVNRITSIADFVASRYGKSQLLGGLVTIIAVVGVIPYISLQLKAVSNSLDIVLGYPALFAPLKRGTMAIFDDTTFLIALLLAAFTILFGTRHLDVTERHEGMVAAIAFESLVKLLAFVAVGIFVTFGIYGGFTDVFAHARANPDVADLLTFSAGHGSKYGSWASLVFLSMMAILFLPRQFQIAVVENVNENHLKKAIWLFPLYLLAMNIFVLPIALGGLMTFGSMGIDADTYILTLPMAHKQQAITLLVFVGGLSAATGMVIVETIALSTMICNDLVMPALLKLHSRGLNEQRDFSGWLLNIRRGAIIVILLLGYAYFRIAGEAYALVSIGLISFSAVAQFAPAMLGGMFWKGGTRLGAISGLVAGFLVWTYTLLLPSFAKSGWLPLSFIDEGLFGMALLKPLQLFGMDGLDDISHCLFWSMLFNVGLYIGVSLAFKPNALEQRQANLFVDAFSHTRTGSEFWRGSAEVEELIATVGRFLGPANADAAFASYATDKGYKTLAELRADADLVHFTETLLAGTIGGASARVLVSSVVKEEALGMDEVMGILDEASQVIAYSRQLEQKSRELEAASNELRDANERLQELDRLKDDFVSTVTHELRTPLTSIRAFSEILRDHQDLPPEQRSRFLSIIIKESERLTRMINQVLDFAKMESGNTEWHASEVKLNEVVEESLIATSQLLAEKHIEVSMLLPEVPELCADRDRLMQVMLNLISNAAKFCADEDGRIEISLYEEADALRVDVKDNGSGVEEREQQIIFEKFRRSGDQGRAHGTGLGLPISRRIVEHFGGKLWVSSSPGCGATFSFTLPLANRSSQSSATLRNVA